MPRNYSRPNVVEERRLIEVYSPMIVANFFVREPSGKGPHYVLVVPTDCVLQSVAISCKVIDESGWIVAGVRRDKSEYSNKFEVKGGESLLKLDISLRELDVVWIVVSENLRSVAATLSMSPTGGKVMSRIEASLGPKRS